MQVKYALDVLGQMPLEGARKARFIVIANDDGTATLRYLWMRGEEAVVSDHVLQRVGRNSMGIDYVFQCEDASFVVTPNDCGCGMGLVAYYPVWGADEPVQVRMPEWLTA